MNIGSTSSATQTIFTKPRHAHGGHHARPKTMEAPASGAAAMPILTATTSGAPAAPAAPGIASLSFAARLSVMNA